MYRIVAIATLGAFLWSGALAEGNPQGQAPEGVDALVGLKATAKLSVPVRESPPRGFLALPGTEVDKLVPEEEYQIKAAKVLPYVFSTQTWVLLSRLDSEEELGWSYFGKDPSKSTNFDWSP